MFASYEVATSFPSLTAIKGYDLDKSADVPLMGHEIDIKNSLRAELSRFYALCDSDSFWTLCDSFRSSELTFDFRSSERILFRALQSCRRHMRPF